MTLRTSLKYALGSISGTSPADGVTILVYHRIGGGTQDERDVSVASFQAQLEILRGSSIVSLDTALDGIDRGDRQHRVVISFDDGFVDVYEHAWPILRERRIPFTLFVATAFLGEEMHWPGSTARATGRGLNESQLRELAASDLCTIGNHTHSHVQPDRVTVSEIDRCSETLAAILGTTPRHFAYTWGVPVPRLEGALRKRFRSAATGNVGRNLPGCDYMKLRRVPVRGTDPLPFFRAKLRGRLMPERAYATLASTAKRIKGSLPGW
jgi:peptidoglycan/xylan/chitin deacetylase (PgdA/CDA1 family)